MADPLAILVASLEHEAHASGFFCPYFQHPAILQNPSACQAATTIQRVWRGHRLRCQRHEQALDGLQFKGYA